MSVKRLIENCLCVVCGLLVLCGSLVVIGTVGALELDNISFTQFFVQEAIAIACLALARLTYLFYEYVKYEQYKY